MQAWCLFALLRDLDHFMIRDMVQNNPQFKYVIVSELFRHAIFVFDKETAPSAVEHYLQELGPFYEFSNRNLCGLNFRLSGAGGIATHKLIITAQGTVFLMCLKTKQYVSITDALLKELSVDGVKIKLGKQLYVTPLYIFFACAVEHLQNAFA